MASKTQASIALLLLSLNLVFFGMVSSHAYTQDSSYPKQAVYYYPPPQKYCPDNILDLLIHDLFVCKLDLLDALPIEAVLQQLLGSTSGSGNGMIDNTCCQTIQALPIDTLQTSACLCKALKNILSDSLTDQLLSSLNLDDIVNSLFGKCAGGNTDGLICPN